MLDKLGIASQKLFEKKDQEIKDFLQEYNNRSLTINRNIAAWLVTIDEEIFALRVEQEPSKNNESKVRQMILLETEYGIEDYSMKEIKNSLIKVEDSSLEENNYPPEIFDKISVQGPGKVKEDTNLVNINELHKWANLLRKKAEVLAWNIKEKEIQSKVEARFGMMNGDRKRMLLSLLNKMANKIKIDRVLKEEENFYQNSELVIEEIEEEEWLATLNKAHNKTVPGVSEIGYILLKKVLVETTKEFIKFANMVLEESKFPQK
ncbi:9083_t:CDS:2 [Gigaspora margarita]|uniref:9083_t:CDS:1 n=1 Tax=Gigaspora margarita TaxID=4874 RepID=A0ABM8VZ46_GIGMA|nr:9083_t:CDS:2 [Gigaspora margarita]